MDRDARRKRDNRNTMILAIVLGCIPAGVCVLGIVLDIYMLVSLHSLRVFLCP